MSSNPTHYFPSPIGGVPLPGDFAPAVIFSIIHAFLVPVVFYRILRSRSRSFVLIGTVLYVIERVVAYALRASAAHSDALRGSENLEIYFQTTLAGGFISMGQDLMILARSLLVGATLGSDMRPHFKLTPRHFQQSPSSSTLTRQEEEYRPLTPGPLQAATFSRASASAATSVTELGGEGCFFEDHPRMRFVIRRFCGISTLVFWAAVILGVVAGIDYKNAIDSGDHAALVRQLWVASTAVTLVLLIGLIFGVLYASYVVPRVPREGVFWLVTVATLLSIVSIYRLVCLRYSTTSLQSDAPGSLNSPSAKAGFYLLEALPETLAAAALMSLNVQRVFATGRWGDTKSRDPSPEVITSARK